MNTVSVVGLALLLAAPATKDPPKKAEPPGLVGEWAVEGLVRGGKEFPVAAAEGMSIEFKADGKFQSGPGRTRDRSYDRQVRTAQIGMITGTNGRLRGSSRSKGQADFVDDRGAGAVSRPASIAGRGARHADDAQAGGEEEE